MRGEENPYDSVRDVWLRTGLAPRVLERLADADAFGSLGLSRREALWAAKALGRVGDRDDDLPLFAVTLPRAGRVDAEGGGVGVVLNQLSLHPLPGSPLRGEAAVRARGEGKPRARRRPAAHAAGRGGGQRLPLPAPVAARASGAVPARRSRTPRHLAQRDAAQRRQQRARAHFRAGHLPAAAGLGQGRGVHDHRGRKRDRQCHRLAESVRARAPGGAGRALCGGRRPRAGGERRHPRGRRRA